MLLKAPDRFEKDRLDLKALNSFGTAKENE